MKPYRITEEVRIPETPYFIKHFWEWLLGDTLQTFNKPKEQNDEMSKMFRGDVGQSSRQEES